MQAKTLPLATIFFILASPVLLHAQQIKPASEIIPKDQTPAIITEAVKKQFAINFPILRLYKYVDASGQYYCLLTEKFDSITKDSNGEPDTLHHAIRALALKADSGILKKVWEINDHALRDPKLEGIERSIWFWTKFIEFSDFDGDGLIDPIIVYGSSSDSDLSSGRIKFIIYYKGRKIAIRHQDSDLDEGRGTQVDKDYHTLPQKLKEGITAKMKAINKANLGIFEKTSF